MMAIDIRPPVLSSIGLHIAPDLWQQLCTMLATYPSCTVLLLQHESQVVGLKLEVTVRPKKSPRQWVTLTHMPSDKE